MVDIVGREKIEHLVYSSVVNADKNRAFLTLRVNIKLSNTSKILIPYTIIGPTFFMDKLAELTHARDYDRAQLALPLSPSLILQQSALENTAEFFALVLECCNSFLGKRIDIHLISQQESSLLKVLSDGIKPQFNHCSSVGTNPSSE